MESPCYRCVTSVEDGTAFCPSCNAPQIKVAVPERSPAETSTIALPPGTPDSIQPPAVPVNLDAAGEIQWKRFLRVGLPLSILGCFSVAVLGPYGMLVCQGIVAIAVARYRRNHHGFLRGSQGALLGASLGFFIFVVYLLFFVTEVAINPTEFHSQMVANIQQTFADNPSPLAQQLAQLAISNFWGFVLLALSFAFVVTVVLSGITGALTASFSRRKYQ